MARLFDVYIAVDWSARSKPSARRNSENSIWVGKKIVLGLDHSQASEENFRTRFDCYSYLQEYLNLLIAEKKRVFIGFDFGFGYPQGFAQALGLVGQAAPWLEIWEFLASQIEDDTKNRNNRFEVAAHLNERFRGECSPPFWGCPTSLKLTPLSMKKNQSKGGERSQECQSMEDLRLTEKGIKGVQSMWKLFGNGSVGSQSLMGIPVLYKLITDPALKSHSRVWPFNTGFSEWTSGSPGPGIVYAEIWPMLAPGARDKKADEYMDQVQVRAVVNWLTELDQNNQLGSYFDRPGELTDEQVETVCREEGWIFGRR